MSIAPESAYGIAAATEFQTLSVGINHEFPTRTYVNLDAEWLSSEADRTIGVLGSSRTIFSIADELSRARQRIDYDERSATLSINQLLGKEWSAGVRYRISEAETKVRFPDINPALTEQTGYNRDDKALLQPLNLTLIYNLPCGFFAQAESIYARQHLEDDLAALNGDDLWQFNAYVGYRFWRRHAEARVGVLNITDQDYKLHPVNLYSELPRERMLYGSFKFYF